MYQNSSSLSRFGTLFLVRVLKQNCKRNLAVFRRGAGSTKNDRFWYSLASSSVSEKSSSRKPAVPKVATYRILTQVGEYRGCFWGAGGERRGACSGLSTPCMSMQNLGVPRMTPP